MAGNSVIGALRVVIGADTASLETGLKRSQASLSSFGANVKASMALASAAIAGSMLAIGHSIKSAIDEADKLGKMAQSVGIPVEELSKLKHAADLSGVSMEQLGVGMGRLAKNMAEAAKNPMSEAAMAFRAVGVSATAADGSLKPLTEITTQLSGKFAGFEDGAGKTALAIQLLGKSGASLIPLLNSGADGLRDMMKEAEDLGLVIDSKTAKSAEAFNDNLTRMGKIKDGIVLKITAQMLPAFQNLSQMMLDASKNTDLMASAASGITNFLKGTVEAALTAGLVFQRLGAELTALWRVAMAPDWASMKAAWAEFGKAGDETKTKFSALKDTIGKFWTDSAAVAEKTASDFGPKVAAPIVQSAEKAQNALEQFLSSQAKKTAAMNADAQTVGMAVGAHEKLRVTLEAQAISIEKQIPINDLLRARIEATGNAAAAAAQKIAGAQVTQEVMTPAEKFAQQMEQQRILYEQGAISAETFGRKQRQIAEQAGATWDIAGASMAGSFAQIAQAFGKEGSTMAKAAKVLGIVQGTISMFTGAAKALELPFPANIAAMATVLAKGASLVASIKGQSVPGFKMGANFKVPGGIGGGDKVPISFMAEPGEQVQVTPNGGGANGNQPGSRGVAYLNITGDSFSRENMRKMFEQMIDMQRDGYSFEMAR